MNFSELAASRHSVRHYQPGLTIDDATLTSIFEDVLLSPSSFNLQHWSFVVVRDAASSDRLSLDRYEQMLSGMREAQPVPSQTMPINEGPTLPAAPAKN